MLDCIMSACDILNAFGVKVLQSSQDDTLSDPAPFWEENPLIHQYTNTQCL